MWLLLWWDELEMLIEHALWTAPLSFMTVHMQTVSITCGDKRIFKILGGKVPKLKFKKKKKNLI